MDRKISFKTIWHEAGISALVLTAVCVAQFLLEASLSGSGATWAAVLNTAAKVAKIFLCVYLVRLYMYRFHKEYTEAERGDVRRLGTTICLLSAAILSAVMMAYYMWHPEIFTQAMDSVMPQIASKMDRNSLDALEKIESNFPQITFISNFIYCAIWAYILPAILAPRIVSSNPFDEEDDDE